LFFHIRNKKKTLHLSLRKTPFIIANLAVYSQTVSASSRERV